VTDVAIDSILAARRRIASGVVLTPCQESPALSELTGCTVYAKLEYLQRTGSFKDRGARNALLLLSEEQRKIGVVAASAGNHALALAYHGRDLGIPVTVVMPVFAPLIKQVRCRDFGANVVLSGANIGEAKFLADQLAEEKGYAYVHGFDGAEVIAGQGTVGIEILEQVPDVEAIVVPVGGAGLIAGIGLAVKTMKPDTLVIGVEPERAASYKAALEAGEPVLTPMGPTLGDGLAVPTVGPRAFAIARKYVDDVVTVDESTIALSILRLLELEKGVVEGGGASSLAALISGNCPRLKGKKVAIVLCGGNIDPNVLSRVIEYGLVADGRLAQFRATISDRPGGLASLAQAIAAVGASVKQITHERAFASADVSTVDVEVVVETRDRAHFKELIEKLQAAGIRCQGKSEIESPRF
jgi:threonine dehydratase